MKSLIVHLNQQLLMMMIHEVHQNDVLVHDNMIMHRNLDHFVNYLYVLIEKPKQGWISFSNQ